MYSLFVGSFGIKCLLEVLVSKVSSDPFFFVVVLWVYSLSDGFFRFSMFVRVLGVRTLLLVRCVRGFKV